jgi:hypothetical protein
MKSNTTRAYSKNLKKNLHSKLQDLLKDSYDNPVIKARNTWSVTSEMVLAMLGTEVHTQWFANIKPIVLKNKNLIVQTESQFAAQWINTHYQELVNSIITAQDAKLTCFFIGPANWSNKSKETIETRRF